MAGSALAAQFAQALAPELIKAGARKLGSKVLGTPAQRGMEDVYSRAIESMLEEVARSSSDWVDPEVINVAASVFGDLIADEEIAGMLLGVTLRAGPVPAEDLHARATSLGYQPETLTFDFDTAISVLCSSVWEEFLKESRKEGTRIQPVINEELLVSVRALYHGIASESASQDHSNTTPAAADPGELEAALAKLEELPLDELPERSPLPPGSAMPLRPNPYFVGRARDLRELAVDLKAGSRSALGEISVAASSGLGGIGKTQLASEFVHRYGAYFHSVYWLNFGDPAGVPEEVSSCGGSGRMQFGPEFANLSLEGRVEAVMAEFRSELPRLLVFDNCDDEVLLDQWLPASGGSRILVTGRRQSWDPALGVSSHPVGLLDRSESVQLLGKHRPDLSEDDPDLGEIAAELGDLPLALDLAGRYLARYRNEVTPADYLDELRQPELLEHPSLREARGLSPTRHDMDVWRTFAVSHRRLDPADGTDSTAVALLARVALLAAGEPVPEYLAAWTLKPSGSRDNPPEPARTFRDALERLKNLGLLQELANEEVSMHRLVAAFASVEATDPDAQAAVEEACAHAVARAQRQGQPARQEKLVPHLRSVTNASWGRTDELAASLCSALGVGLGQLGDYDEAILYAERAWSISRDFYQPNDRATLRRRTNVGMLYEAMGDKAEARVIYDEVLRVQKHEYDPDDPDVAATLNNLGASFAREELYHETFPCYNQALQIREAVWSKTPSDDPDRQEHAYRVAESNSNMGALLMDLGRTPHAGPYLDRALKIMGDELQKEHERYAGTKLMRAQALLAIGERVKALEELGDVLDIYHKVATGVPEEAARALAIRGNIFADGAEDEDLDNAKRTLLLEQADQWLNLALKAAMDGYGEGHPVTGALDLSVGAIKEARKDSVAARDHRERAEACRQRNLMGLESDAASTIQGAASALIAWGLYEEARVYLERALDLRIKAAGEQDFETSKSLFKLGILLQLQGDGSQARQYLERALAARSQNQGVDHPATGIVQESIDLLP